jgi:hypothetical protein
MINLIRKLVREEMISFINNWEKNLNLIKEGDTTSITTLISKDNESGDKLWLFVTFKKFSTISEYSYSFMLTDKNNKPVTNDYMTDRNEVSKYLPSEIKNKKQIFPIIMDMTRKLMDAELPQNIYRKTSEPVDGDSLKRYEEITNIMVNEYGYKLLSVEKDWGHTTWKLTREKMNDNNKDMDESYEIIHSYTIQETCKLSNDPILPLLKNYNFKPIFS